MSLLKQFIKYQSLGNHFVLFDWLKKPAVFVGAELSSPIFGQFVQNICNPYCGVGADGVLILVNHPQAGQPEMIIYNADGTRAEMCLNGLRCVAHHLAVTHQFASHFAIRLGGRVIECSVEAKDDTSGEIAMRVGTAEVLEQQHIVTTEGDFAGTKVSIGNPHFFIFKHVALDWLAVHGKQIESNEAFPHKTNVEFVWQDDVATSSQVTKSFGMHVYERGCGITQACSSGVAAFTGLLKSMGTIKHGEKISITMPGGSVIAWVDAYGIINLQGTAKRVFAGVLAD
jgi:diaminopimelate epimerase